MVDEGRVTRLLRGIAPVGFRNVLVHQYTAVDDHVVVGALGRLDEFDRFVAEVSAWMSARPD